MKKSILSLVLLIVAIGITQKTNAQYAIPSFNVLVNTLPTTFEEMQDKNVLLINDICFEQATSITQTSRGRKTVNVNIRPNQKLSLVYARIEIYSLDGMFIYHPDIIDSSRTFSIELDNNCLWGIRVLESSEEIFVDVWI